MQGHQIRLPRQAIDAKSTWMSNSIDHTALCNWLSAVADSRDKQAFTHLFHFFAPKIQGIAQNKLMSEALAKEVVQESMSNVWRKAHLFDSNKGAATTWVYSIMRNVIFDAQRKQKANKEEHLSDDIWPLIEAENAQLQETRCSDYLENKQLRAVIEALPENQKQVLIGFYLMEKSQEQLAKELHLPLGTIKSRLRLALAKLKLQLEGMHHD